MTRRRPRRTSEGEVRGLLAGGGEARQQGLWAGGGEATLLSDEEGGDGREGRGNAASRASGTREKNAERPMAQSQRRWPVELLSPGRSTMVICCGAGGGEGEEGRGGREAVGSEEDGVEAGR